MATVVAPGNFSHYGNYDCHPQFGYGVIGFACQEYVASRDVAISAYNLFVQSVDNFETAWQYVRLADQAFRNNQDATAFLGSAAWYATFMSVAARNAYQLLSTNPNAGMSDRAEDWANASAWLAMLARDAHSYAQRC